MSLFTSLSTMLYRPEILRDSVEVLMLSTAIYGFSVWLRTDTRHNLLSYFYLYAGLIIATHALSLPTLNLLLTACAPVIILLFIIFHQERLQKNFITLTNTFRTTPAAASWADAFMRTALCHINSGRQLLCVIEHKNNLENMLTTTCHVNAPLSAPLLSLMCNSSDFNPQALLWLSSQGIIKGINCTWSMEEDTVWAAEEARSLPVWKQEALLITKHTDALVLCIVPTTRTFDVIVGGKALEQVNAQAALALIKRYSTPEKQIRTQQGKKIYEHAEKKQNINRAP